ncbi:hypothetical protein CMQ_1304 [Grosmannia clavigera kw1407]|uniref:Uncharacterized protein n=1 Tax=Grosmannia clavigera (strain kw1407 / UAMH 11150) TaxID=655863 RepID=F0XC20_GROCL|nr:uncharacterized protein CMQ_1304 [Grosmannia clavigera kw1407]EFX04376.1 hypothetical protein CMQ_1304 [Grosmannia clavigera kw1407]
MTSGSQYQHFVPQFFLLRNFAHNFEPPVDPGTDVGDGKGKRKKKSKKHVASCDKGNLKRYPGDKVVNNVNMQLTPYAIDESPVNRILGLPDMYRDNLKTIKAEQNEVEKKFAHIEGEAQRVFRRITKAYDDGAKVVSLMRPERDLLRKFLFLLKFRGPTFYTRFSHEDIESYCADDKEEFQKYMRKNNFTRPFEIWLRSLKLIMELDMDPERDWKAELMQKMYRLDAVWFIMHVDGMYIYNIFEGPNSFAQDIHTKEITPTAYVNLHEFGPISSKLILVLRSSLLPVPEEDSDPVLRRQRERNHYAAVEDVFGEGTKSVLEDLPIAKPQNSYSELIGGRFIFNSDFTGKLSKKDKFYFRIFSLGTDHVNKINKVLLENTYTCSRIVFGTEKAFLCTLEWYLTQPKYVMGTAALGQHLQRLEELMKTMGCTKKAAWTPIQPTPFLDFGKQRETRRMFHEYMESHLDGDVENSFFSTYKDFRDGDIAFDSFDTDVHQSGLMMKLRIKLDSWSLVAGVDEAIRLRNRIILFEAYLRTPPSRFWLYMKRTRLQLSDPKHAFKRGNPMVEMLGNPRFRDGPENIFAAVKTYVRPDRLNFLIYATVTTEASLERSNVNLWQPAGDFLSAAMQHRFLLKYALETPGLSEVEKLAVTMEKLVVDKQMHRQGVFSHQDFDDDDKVEIMTRILVRSRFKNVMVEMDADLVQRLQDVFFTYTYPTPPTTSQYGV